MRTPGPLSPRLRPWWSRASLIVRALAAAALASGPAGATELASFFGTYVGVAEVDDLKSGSQRERHLDIVIEPYGAGGFRLNWVNVTLVDGQRTLPGVERRIQSVASRNQTSVQ